MQPPVPQPVPNAPVTAWVDKLVLPTYPVQPPEPNPMFFEKRNIQGSTGNIYPNPFTDRLSNQKVDQEWEVVFLENEYIQMIMLPALGGRVFAGLDKTNGYDFFYRQRVIKPALIGLFGPWISGGVEFNWPQHHRPSTFMPVEYTIEESADGSKTVWLSEHEPMNRTKGMVGICLYPGKALVDMKVQLYNRTPYTQTFLWWANAAVHIHPDYQVIFPPDVHYALFHARQFVVEYPIARGMYNSGIDLGSGTDVSWYKNLTIASSFFASESKYEFFGGYDHRKDAGVVNVADRHISPGKKFFTWADGPFGHQWQRNLADADDPYLELMAGCFTDNQPDFSWLQPYETRSFHQVWYPVQRIGPPKNANQRAALNLEVDGRQVRLGVLAVESLPAASISLRAGGQVFLDKQVDLAPGSPFLETLELSREIEPSSLVLKVSLEDGSEVIRYTPEKPWSGTLPEPYQPPPSPQEIATLEELYLVGLHLEQYRHPILEPEDYWEEALRRDPGDIRCNNALGKLYLRRADFARAEGCFRKAIQRLTWRNLHPYDGEPYYNLGLVLRLQARYTEAYAAFYKATWSSAWQCSAFYALALIDSQAGELAKALDHVERSLQANAMHLQARNLRASLLRRMGDLPGAEGEARQTIRLDPLDFGARNELVLALRLQHLEPQALDELNELKRIMRLDPQNYLDLAGEYSWAGMGREAIELLERIVQPGRPTYPMILYAMGYISKASGFLKKGQWYYQKAAQQPPDYCFPWRAEEKIALENAIRSNPQDARARYYLGNLLYDKRHFAEAIRLWEEAASLEPGFSIPWRNLGLAAYNIQGNLERALEYLQMAFDVNRQDARLLGELDQLRKRQKTSPELRLMELEKHIDVVIQRDDVTIELVGLYNRTGHPEKALEMLQQRHFHPWEGGEGLVAGGWSAAHLLLGRAALEAGRPQEALAHFEQSMTLPHTLGESGFDRQDAVGCYHAGLAKEALGNLEAARREFEQALGTTDWSASGGFYRALALLRLGRSEEARQRLQEMLETARVNQDKPFERNYFSPMNPSALFMDDLGKLARLYWTFQQGLAHLGLGETQPAKQAFARVLELDPSHLEAWEAFRRL